MTARICLQSYMRRIALNSSIIQILAHYLQAACLQDSKLVEYYSVRRKSQGFEQ